eukprot:297368_1
MSRQSSLNGENTQHRQNEYFLKSIQKFKQTIAENIKKRTAKSSQVINHVIKSLLCNSNRYDKETKNIILKTIANTSSATLWAMYDIKSFVVSKEIIDASINKVVIKVDQWADELTTNK